MGRRCTSTPLSRCSNAWALNPISLDCGQAARGGMPDLSGRERQVLALVASGKTNRQIAVELGISEHTVARYLSNIFNKIGVTTRTAAGAFAFEHGLV